MSYISIAGTSEFDTIKISMTRGTLSSIPPISNINKLAQQRLGLIPSLSVESACCPGTKVYETYEFDSDKDGEGVIDLVKSTLKRMRYYPITGAGKNWYSMKVDEAIKVVVQCIKTIGLNVEGEQARRKRQKKEDDVAHGLVVKRRNQLVEDRLDELERMIRWKPGQTSKFICQAGSYDDFQWGKFVLKRTEVRKKEILIEQEARAEEARQYALAQRERELVRRYEADSAGIAEGFGVFFGICLFLGLIWAVVAAVVSVM